MNLFLNSSSRSDKLLQLDIPRFIINLTWACCVLMAFDFRGETSGGIYQIASFLTVIVLLAVVILVLSLREINYPSTPLKLGLYFFITYLASTLVVAVVQSIPLERYQVVVAPYILLVGSYWMTANLCRRYGVVKVLNLLTPALKSMVFISIIWTLYYGFSKENASVMSVRYRIISEVMPFAVAYLSSALISKNLSHSDKIFGILALIILIVGQTRSYLIVFVFAIIFSSLGHSVGIKKWIYSTGKYSIYIIFLMAILIIFDAVFNLSGDSSFVEAWGRRMFGGKQEFGFDQTTASRLAEYHDQMIKLFSSFENAIMGRGLGASYTYSGINADLFSSVLGIDAIPQDYWNGGHSLWVYTLFASGLIFGVALLCFYFYAAWMSVKLLRLTGKLINNEVDRHRMVAISVGYLCFIGTSFSAYPLGSRSIAFVMGILISLQFSIWSLFRSKYNLA